MFAAASMIFHCLFVYLRNVNLSEIYEAEEKNLDARALFGVGDLMTSVPQVQVLIQFPSMG